MNNTSFMQLLNRSAKPLADFLGEYLPEVDEDWWNYLVLNSLSDFARRNVGSDNGSLYDLDIATLLKVFDANWHSLSSVIKLDYVLRNYIKEMQSIRNKWAHQTLDGIPDEIIERHLSTLYLLCKEINADEAFLSEINDARNLLLSKQFGV
ncbi:MAG TPA: Swt1 family HEPN domain-containing protein, partial [Methanocorpusculum sp.]|nr:Swt1 family HEPN domain-containing protein [Methanocorpusculum sp.]